mmetsp:Transcript_12385/g.24904  ORF Transcript_12385/g.24904 Transcript_12385/m.24904 type:complete len:108 (+) Transcript_12385:282-605(+)
MNRFLSTDGSTHNVEVQERCMREGAVEGLKSGLTSLAVSSAAVLGACKAFPAFNRSLTVSSRTALIVTPFFGAFVLMGELELNACARRHSDFVRQQQRLLADQKKTR